MTRIGAGKATDPAFTTGRLAVARSFLRMAEAGMTLAEEGLPQNPVISNTVLSAIAYSDALTAKFKGRVNQKDHRAVVKALRDALGNRFPVTQETRLSRILSSNDDVQYGARTSTAGEALRMLELLRDFAQWAEEEMTR